MSPNPCYFNKEVGDPVDAYEKISASASAFVDCHRCEITCVAQRLPGVAAVTGVQKAVKALVERKANEAIRRLTRHFARNVNIVSTVYDVGAAIHCVGGCK